MKRYRLIKKYPGSPKLGTELHQIGDKFNNYWDTNTIKDIKKELVENNPEFWEEVVEDNNPLNLVLGKTYKIRYKFCDSFIRICKVDRFTQHGYPWSNSLGGIITDSYELIEEVVEKDYEILTYRNFITGVVNVIGQRFLSNEGYREFTERDLNAINEPTGRKVYSIYSVKRLSDGEVFTVGDKAISKYSNYGNITEFEQKYNNIYITTKMGRNTCVLKDLKSVKKPLFTTEDGVDIFLGDKVFGVDRNLKVFEFDALCKNDNEYFKRFSTKEAAEEYIFWNKNNLSLKDVFDVYPLTKKQSGTLTKHAIELIDKAKKI